MNILKTFLRSRKGISGGLEKFSKTTNCTRNLLRAREIFGLRQNYSIFNTNFTRNHVSSNLCCYLQVLPCHLKLRARFHIRFKRHAGRMDQVRHFSTKICVLKTLAKPVTFLVCCKRAMYLYGKTTIRPIGSLYFPEFF